MGSAKILSEEDRGSSRSSGSAENSSQCPNRFLRVMTSQVCGKIFWVLLVACGTGILIYGLYRTKTNRVVIGQNGDVPLSLINAPQQQQWNSNYYDIVPSTEMEFPKIYICPSNYINNTYLHNSSKTEELLRLYRKSLILQHKPDNRNRTKREATSDFLQNMDNNNLTSEEMYKMFMQVGYDQDELFVACSFRSFFAEILPCKSIVQSILDPNFGKCYLVTVDGEQRKQQIPGQGLILVLNLHQDLFPTSPTLAPVTRGYIVRIGKEANPGDFRFLYVASGTYTKIDMTQEHVMYDNGECVEESRSLKMLTGNYSQSSCLLDCLLQTVLDTCDCVPLMDRYFLRNTNGSPNYCTMETIDRCVLPNVTENAESIDKIEKCRSGCLPACRNYHYDIKTTQLPLNPDAGIAKHGIDADDLLYLHVAFSNFETKSFHQYRPSGQAALYGQILANSAAEMFVNNDVSSVPRSESLWVVAGVALLIQIPTAIALICLFALYRQLYHALPRVR